MFRVILVHKDQEDLKDHKVLLQGAHKEQEDRRDHEDHRVEADLQVVSEAVEQQVEPALVELQVMRVLQDLQLKLLLL